MRLRMFCILMAVLVSSAGSAADSCALDFDFASAAPGMPDGATCRTCAEAVEGRGLHATAYGNNDAAGCTLGRRTLPPAFELTVSFEVCPAEELVDGNGDPVKASGMIWDDMYVTSGVNCGMQLRFEIVGTRWTPILHVGLGDRTCSVNGPMHEVVPGGILSLTLRFYGDRDIEWDFAGDRLANAIPCAGAVAPGNRPVTVGDRVSSIHMAFRGYIRRLAVTPLARAPFCVRTTGRAAFPRGEGNAKLTVEIENVSGADVASARFTAIQQGIDADVVGEALAFDLGRMAAGEVRTVEVPVETRVRSGWQRLRTETTADGIRSVKNVRFGVGPVFADRMPVLMWQGGTVRQVRSFGMTHEMVDFGVARTQEEGADPVAGLARLDDALVEGLQLANGSGTIRYPPDEDTSKYLRLDRNGNPYEGNPVEVSNPELIARARAIAAANAALFGDHPAFGGVLNCSETRETSRLSFNRDHIRYREETGRDVPDEAVSTTFGRTAADARYPDGLVPDDDPVLAFYRWFWSGGDGWPMYLSAGYDEYRKVMGRYGDGSARQRAHPFFSWWDPSVRCPPRWNCCGDTDVLNQWVYSYPEAMNVGGPAEESLAMAAGRPGQQVFMMTQLINYRSQVAPMTEAVTPAPDWVMRRPHASFPTLPPDSLQEATWTMLAKPIQGIMYHGWGSIFETGEPTGYVYTNPESAERLRHLLSDVVGPLGPTLKRLGREAPPVAILESFTSVINGMPWSSGYSAAHVTFLQRARLDPRVVYEETLERDGFAGIRVLYAPQCRFVTPSLVRKIDAFQAQGGILVADAELNPALTADIVVPVPSTRTAPSADRPEAIDGEEEAFWQNVEAREFTARQKENSIAATEALRTALRGRFDPKADSDTPEIVTYSRRWGETDYVVAVNDHRTFGDYVGQWGRTMEKGLPVSGHVTLCDPSDEVKAVYELSRGGEVAFEREDGRVKVKLDYETNDGRFLLFLRDPIASLSVECPADVEPGGTVEAALTVLGESGAPVPAILPVEIRLYDAAGRELDGAGYLAAADGAVRVAIRTNVNDAHGDYRLVFRDRASGLAVERTVATRVRGAATAAYVWDAAHPLASGGDVVVRTDASGAVEYLSVRVSGGDTAVFTGDPMAFAADAVVRIEGHGSLTFSNDVAAAGAIAFRGDAPTLTFDATQAPYGFPADPTVADLVGGNEVLAFPGVRNLSDYTFLEASYAYNNGGTRYGLSSPQFEERPADSLLAQFYHNDGATTRCLRPRFRQTEAGLMFGTADAWAVADPSKALMGTDFRGRSGSSTGLCCWKAVLLGLRSESTRRITLAGGFSAGGRIDVGDCANLVFGKGSVISDGSTFTTPVNFSNGSLTFVDPGDFATTANITGRYGDVHFSLPDGEEAEPEDVAFTEPLGTADTVILPNTSLSSVTGVSAKIGFIYYNSDRVITLTPDYSQVQQPCTRIRNTGKTAYVWFHGKDGGGMAYQAAMQLTQSGRDVVAKKVNGSATWIVNQPTANDLATWNPYVPAYGKTSGSGGNYSTVKFDISEFTVHLSVPKGTYGKVRNAVTLSGNNSVVNGRYRFTAGKNRRLDATLTTRYEGPCANSSTTYAELHVCSNAAVHLAAPDTAWSSGVGGVNYYGVSHVVHPGGALCTADMNYQVNPWQSLFVDDALYLVNETKFNGDKVQNLRNITYSNGARTAGSPLNFGWSTSNNPNVLKLAVTGDAPSVADNDLTTSAAATMTFDVDDVTGDSGADFIANGYIRIGGSNVSATKTGAGTLLANNVITCAVNPFRLKEGTLLLGKSVTVSPDSGFAFDGGTLAMASGASNRVAKISVAAGGGEIDLADGAKFIVADCTGEDWTGGGVVNIVGNTRKAEIRFGDSADALTKAQLLHLRLNGKEFALDENGYPERSGTVILVR